MMSTPPDHLRKRDGLAQEQCGLKARKQRDAVVDDARPDHADAFDR